MKIEELRQIYRKTDGYCHLCYKKLKFSSYGKPSSEGSWQIEHSRPIASGGTNHVNNLYPACVQCNLEKGILNTRTIRLRNGKTRAPYSKQRKDTIRTEKIVTGAIIGSGIGMVLLGPGGGILGGTIGGILGNNNSPKK